MRRTFVWLAAALLVAAMCAPALGAPNAPTYVTSDPQNGATVSSPPARVSVTFSEPLDSASTLQVFDQCGRSVDAGDSQVLGSRIDVGLAQTPAGHYTAVYVARGFAGATGETKGSFSFHVTAGESCDGSADHHHHGGGGGDDDGGHDGHGGGGDEHSGHGGSSEEGHHDSGTHSGHDAEGHDGAGHASGEHASGEHDAQGHDADAHGQGHGGGDHHGDSRSAHSGRNGGKPLLASGPGGPGLAPTSTSVVIALTLSIAMGALGGWVLRVSAAK